MENQESTDQPKSGTQGGLGPLAPKTGGLVLPDQVLPPNLYVLPINSPITFPTLLAPLLISHPSHVAMVEEAINRQRLIGLMVTREGDVSAETGLSELHSVGVAVKMIKRLKVPDGGVHLLVHSVKRFRIKKVLSEKPYIVVETEYLNDVVEKGDELDALNRAVVSHVKKLSEVNPFFTEEMRMAMINAPGPGAVADLVAFALALPKPDAQELLETLDVKKRFEKLLVHLSREQNVADLQKKISDDVNHKLTKLQREFFLKEQLKSIKRELGMEEDPKDRSARTLRERIEAAGMPEDVKSVALSELDRFETIPESSPEHNISRTYLETLAALPWSKETLDSLDLKRARQILDAGHFGLERVKERILEFLAVRKLKRDPKGSILCLVGPPGVGKTSVGKSIAETLGRNFFRFSLGGMRDEAEIKGHRRTYVGALPGKLIQGLKRAGSKNAVLMLDEIDKLGTSLQGDPASALLEALDPEQNSAFLDHYLDVPFDLSRVLFITTANTTTSIPAPLLDRMEVIELTGYTLEEKEDIAMRYLLPRELQEAGLKPQQIKIDAGAMRKMITDYAREPGLRSLQKLVSRIARKAAAQIVSAQEGVRSGVIPMPARGGAIRVRAEDLPDWLGPERFHNEVAERATQPGVATGLAWTSMGGEILFIEATDLPGTGQIKLTGQMGEVMTESAAIAWSSVKKKAHRELGRDSEFWKSTDFHLHIPAGAIPKDGPSAGVTMAVALWGLLSGRKVRPRLAMTGELSLVGKVLPVGGIKEKLLAARRSGVETVLLPKLNKKDLREVPAAVLEGLKIIAVERLEDVFAYAFEDEPKRPSSGVSRKRAKRASSKSRKPSRRSRS